MGFSVEVTVEPAGVVGVDTNHVTFEVTAVKYGLASFTTTKRSATSSWVGVTSSGYAKFHSYTGTNTIPSLNGITTLKEATNKINLTCVRKSYGLCGLKCTVVTNQKRTLFKLDTKSTSSRSIFILVCSQVYESIIHLICTIERDALNLNVSTASNLKKGANGSLVCPWSKYNGLLNRVERTFGNQRATSRVFDENGVCVVSSSGEGYNFRRSYSCSNSSSIVSNTITNSTKVFDTNYIFEFTVNSRSSSTSTSLSKGYSRRRGSENTSDNSTVR